MSEGPHAVHGMGRELTEPDWPPLTDDELRGVLGREPAVIWRSPRPMSAAAVVRHGDATVFVKRHHLSVRTPAQLAAEHAFAAHLRMQGQPVPATLPLAGGHGLSVLRRGRLAVRGLLTLLGCLLAVLRRLLAVLRSLLAVLRLLPLLAGLVVTQRREVVGGRPGPAAQRRLPTGDGARDQLTAGDAALVRPDRAGGVDRVELEWDGDAVAPRRGRSPPR